MSKLNPVNSGESKFDDERLAGGAGLKSAKQSSIALLRRATLANLLWEDNAYIDGKSVAEQIRKLVPLCKPEEVRDLAVECRTDQKLRHTPLFLAVCMLKHEYHAVLVEDLLPRIITRADMITDFMAIYFKENKPKKGKSRPAIASAAKRGLSKCFNKFSEYQLAKYDRNAPIKLRDVMFLVHPKPDQGKEELFKKIADRTLTVPDTWEVALSTGKDKKETWERLIKERKLGALAFLRNLRNMRDAKVNHNVIKEGFASISSQILLPLNFLSAAKHNPEFKAEIGKMMVDSYANLPKLPGRTLFIVDVSGSMQSGIAGKSQWTRQDVANAMALLAVNQCESYEIVCTAGSDHKSKHDTAKIDYPSKDFSIFDQIEVLKRKLGGGGIFTRQCLEWCKENISGEFDRIIVFSDSQDTDRVNRIPKPYAKNNYICDVSAHSRGVNYKGVWTAEISGWSEHFLTYIAAMEGIQNQFNDTE